MQGSSLAAPFRFARDTARRHCHRHETQFTFNLNSTTSIDNGGIVTGSFLYTLDGGADPANLYFAQKSGSVVSRATADVNTTDSFTGAAGGAQQIRINTTTTGQTWTNTGDISAQKGVLFVGADDYTISGGTFGNSIPGSGTQNTRGIIIATWGAGTLTITANVTNGNGNSQLTKQGPGTLILTNANTYPSATNINGGVLSIAQIGNGGNNASGLGISSNAATNLNLDGGTLRYTGAAASTDRLFRLNADSGIDASGSGALNWTNTGRYTVNSVAGPKTLTLKGTNTGANTLAGLLSDENASTGQTSLLKSGSGTWVLTNANTYTGGTTVSAGLLLANNTTGSATGTGTVTVSAGTLGGTGTVGTVALASGGTLAPGNLAATGTLTVSSLALVGGGTINLSLIRDTLVTDFLAVVGNLDISALSSGSQLNLTLTGLSGTFDAESSHTFGSVVTFASLTGTFATDKFNLDTNGFGQAFAGGFALVQNGNALDLQYSPIPEPSACAALIGAAALLVTISRRKSSAN